MGRASCVGSFCVLVGLLASGCRDAPVTVTAEPSAASSATSASPAAATRASALHLGAPIEESAPTVALSDVAKNPGAWAGRSFATEGTVTAVCQHMGCWMELRGVGDGAADAHVKMAGHHFFVPRTAAGHKARVLATLEPADPAGAEASSGSCAEEGNAATAGGGAGETHGSCRAEAEAQLGHPLSKVELVADGVELM